MPGVGTVAVLALCAFRVVRLVQGDSITLALRERLFTWAWNDAEPDTRTDELTAAPEPTPRAAWRAWLYELVAVCPWCLGAWVSTGAYSAWRWGGGWGRGFVAVAAIAGVQGLVSSWSAREPS